MLRSGTAAGLGASLGFGLLPAAACELFPRGGGWRFLVLRHGNAIGEHVFRFSRRDGDFVVEVAIDIAVEMLGITVFRFTHRAEEVRSEEHTSELQSLMRISYAVFCLKKKNHITTIIQ